MVFEEVSSESWFSRLFSSIKSVLIGIILFIISFPLLMWNESRAVKRTEDLEFGRGAVVADVDMNQVSPDLDGKLVHVRGLANSKETLTDKMFGITAENAVKLNRVVEMYQWEERKETKTRKKLGGGKEKITTYHYDQVWEDHQIDSKKFNSRGRDEEGANNPPMPYSGASETAKLVTLGAFQLNNNQKNSITGGEAVQLTQDHWESLSDELKEKLRLEGNEFYLGEDPQNPAIGDVRIRFNVVQPTDVTVVAAQSNNSFTAFQAPNGKISQFRMGLLSADEVFEAAENDEALLRWGLRALGFGLMAFGIGMLFSPFVVFADVIPFVGNILGAGVAIFAIVIAGMLSLVTIAIAWIAVRPLLGITLLVVGVGLVVGATMMFRKKRDEKYSSMLVEE